MIKTKKTTLQVVLKNKCIKYKYTRLTFLFLIQTFQIAIAIKIYRMVQTGPKTQSGGLNDGLTNVEYQGSLNLKVVIPPINEAEKVVIRNKNKDTNLFLSI